MTEMQKKKKFKYTASNSEGPIAFPKALKNDFLVKHVHQSKQKVSGCNHPPGFFISYLSARCFIHTEGPSETERVSSFLNPGCFRFQFLGMSTSVVIVGVVRQLADASLGETDSEVLQPGLTISDSYLIFLQSIDDHCLLSLGTHLQCVE